MLTRRAALRIAPPALLAAACPGLAFARAPATSRRFLVVILRGAMDGLAAIPPLADPDYAALRGKLSLGTPAAPQGAKPLDGRFWLHPALAPLHPFWQRGELAVIHAAASPYRERSHFDAQNMLETGLTRPGAANDGWLNRALLAAGADAGPGSAIRAVAFTPAMPLLLAGRAPAANWQPEAPMAALNDQITALYAGNPRLSAAWGQALAAGGAIEAASIGLPRKRDFPALCAIAGHTLAAPDGPNVAVLELGGWDTHVGQGLATGRLANALATLAQGLMALAGPLAAWWPETAVLALTEFGRTARPNGTDGTDHGTAGAALLLGGAVAGGHVFADWPGLSPGALYQRRDLAPTTDLRAVLKGVLGDHLRLTRAALEGQVFAGSAEVRPLAGLIKA